MTRRLLALATATIALGALAACASGDPDLGSFEIEGSWTLESGESGGSAITPVEGAPITLDVDAEGAVSGKDGCNNVMSTVTVEGTSVSFGPVAGTMMACEQPIMDVATAYTGALEKVTTGAIEDGDLVLTGDGVELRYTAG